MYLATCTWPDIAYTVRELAKFMSNFGKAHITAAKHLLHYEEPCLMVSYLVKPMLHILYSEPYPILIGMGEFRKFISGFIIFW